MRKLAVIVAAILLAFPACGNPSHAAGRHPRTPKPIESIPVSMPTGTPVTARCHASSLNPATALPDKACTPGATNPAVDQHNIHQTICVPGYSRTIRPPVAYTDALKRQQIREYGYANTSPGAYEEDHLIPLSFGGAPRDPHNLWPEPGASPNPKDDIEYALYKAVCAGRISLAGAQQAIATDWTTALQVAH